MKTLFTVALICFAMAAEPCGGQSTPNRAWKYMLLEGSSLTDRCLPCVGPGVPQPPQPLRGSFNLVQEPEGPWTMRYSMKDITFFVGSQDNPAYAVSGSGSFQIGGHLAVLQDMALDVQVANRVRGTNEFHVFTNEVRSVEVRFPLIQISLTQTQASEVWVYSMDLVAAPARDIWFSTLSGFTSGNSTNHGTGGDLLSRSGRIVRSFSRLLQSIGVASPVPGLGVDAFDIGPGGEIFFSLNQNVTSTRLGALHHGDLLSDRSHIVQRNQDLTAAFTLMMPVPDLGLDALAIKDDGEILFSIQTQAFSQKLGRTLKRGDVLSHRGQIFRSNPQLLAQFSPNIPSADYGLDALYVWPNGEIWFSTETGFDSRVGAIQEGDLLSDQGLIVFRNLELMSAFQPVEDLSNFGLDGLFVLTDTLPSAAPPRFVESGRQGSNLVLRWSGPGRVFQLEQARSVTGPFDPLSVEMPDLDFIDIGALTNRSEGCYRLQQW